MYLIHNFYYFLSFPYSEDYFFKSLFLKKKLLVNLFIFWHWVFTAVSGGSSLVFIALVLLLQNADSRVCELQSSQYPGSAVTFADLAVPQHVESSQTRD